MRRVLFTLHGLNIYSYPAMVYVGLVAGVFAGARVAELDGLSADAFAIAAMILLVPGLIGSRLLFVLIHWPAFRDDPRRIWRRREGGGALYGGLILMVPLSIPVLGALMLPFGKFWDAGTFTMLVGMIFTRIGCLLNGCCSGRPTAGWLGLELADHRGVTRRRIPTQILEMGLAVILLGAALAARGRAPFEGAIFCSSVAAYGATRFVLEGLRDEEQNRRDRPAMQAISAALAMAGLGAIVLIWLL